MTSWLPPVADALDAAPEAVTLYFRDDDAGWDDGRLLALLDRVAETGAPLDLAVIPAALHPPLAAELRARAGPALRLHQHGLAHVNHQREGRRCEFGSARSYAAQRRDIADGKARLDALLGATDPVFTPPWNRCTPVTGRCLAELGFRVLSRESRAAPLGIDGLVELPIHVDWVRLDRRAAGERLAATIRAGHPAGVMFHHAEMDAASRADAAALLRLAVAHDRARPAPLMAAAGMAAATPG